jgi:hypothetical protein
MVRAAYDNSEKAQRRSVLGRLREPMKPVVAVTKTRTFAVINRHSRAEAGRPSISINSCNQSSAESSACSGPYN